MKIRPILDRVVLEPIEETEQTINGILIPNSTQEKPSLAKVVAVGEGGFVDGQEVKMLLNVGDKVLYAKYAGSEIKFEGKKYVVIKQADILAVVE